MLPDFKDLSPEFIDKEALQQPRLIDDRRQIVLSLINRVRSSFGVQEVYTDQTLNGLAQNYSEAMLNGNFFGHYDPQGRSPNERAKALGI